METFPQFKQIWRICAIRHHIGLLLAYTLREHSTKDGG